MCSLRTRMSGNSPLCSSGHRPFGATALLSPLQTQVEDDRAELEEQRRAQQQSGYRLADGRWRGERYGAVCGVAVGCVPSPHMRTPARGTVVGTLT